MKDRMKTVSAILYAIALTALLCLPYVSWGQDKRDGVALDGGTLVDGRRLDGTDPFAAPGYLIEEYFEETGVPTAGNWSVLSGTLSWDSTTHINMTGEAVFMSGSGQPEAITSFSAQTDVWAACKFEVNAGVTFTDTQSLFGIRTSAGGALTLFQTSATDRVKIWAGGSEGTASSTFSLADDTLYYVWLHYVASGTCEFYISTTPSRPALGTDTATQFASSKADVSGSNAERLSLRGNSGVFSVYFDEVFVSTSELTNPWGD